MNHIQTHKDAAGIVDMLKDMSGAPKPEEIRAATLSECLVIRGYSAGNPDENAALPAGRTVHLLEGLCRPACEALRLRNMWRSPVRVSRKWPVSGLLLHSGPFLYLPGSVTSRLNITAQNQPEWARALCAYRQAIRRIDRRKIRKQK